MRVLVYGATAETAMGRMCARALEEIGHEVGYFERNSIHLPLVGKYSLNSTHNGLEQTVVEEEVNALLVIKGYDLSHERLKRIWESTEATLLNWNPDNPYQVRSKQQHATDYLDTLSVYDVVFTWGEFLITTLEEDGGTDVRYLPFAHDPSYHYPADPRAEYNCEVAFLGHYSSKREQYLSSLTEFDFQVRGNMWRWKCFDLSLRRAYQSPALGHPEYARAMASADIIVNVVADHNIPAQNMRTFEAPASGTLMVTTRTEGQQRYFPDEEACVMYDDPEELREVVAYYLDDDEEREAIAARGQEYVQEHTYADRMRKLVAAASKYS